MCVRVCVFVCVCVCACMCLCVCLSVLPVALGVFGKQLFHDGLHSNEPAGDRFVDQGVSDLQGGGGGQKQCIENRAYDSTDVWQMVYTILDI